MDPESEKTCLLELTSMKTAQRENKIRKIDLFQCPAYLICCLSSKYLSGGLMGVQCAVCAVQCALSQGDPGVTPSEAVAIKIPLHCKKRFAIFPSRGTDGCAV